MNKRNRTRVYHTPRFSNNCNKRVTLRRARKDWISWFLRIQTKIKKEEMKNKKFRCTARFNRMFI